MGLTLSCVTHQSKHRVMKELGGVSRQPGVPYERAIAGTQVLNACLTPTRGCSKNTKRVAENPSERHKRDLLLPRPVLILFITTSTFCSCNTHHNQRLPQCIPFFSLLSPPSFHLPLATPYPMTTSLAATSPLLMVIASPLIATLAPRTMIAAQAQPLLVCSHLPSTTCKTSPHPPCVSTI